MPQICFSIAILATSVSAAVRDMCTAIKSTSFCMDSGFCSDMDPALTCRSAYVTASEGLLRVSSQPPIVSKISTDISELLVYSRGDKKMFSSHGFERSVAFANFERSLLEFNYALCKDFPYLMYGSGDVHRQLLAAAAVLGGVTFKLQQTILSRSVVNSISAQIRNYIELIASLSRIDPFRISVFANLVPFIHAWMRLHTFFSLPPPLLAPEYFEFLTSVAQYDPLYPTQEEEKIWKIALPIIEFELKRSGPVVPFIDQTDPVPFPVLDFLGLPIDGELDISKIVSECDPTNRHNLWLSIMVMANHHKVTEDHKSQFCSKFLTSDRLVFPVAGGRNFGLKNLEAILDLYRLCGDRVVSFEYRTNIILPFILRRSSLTSNIEFPRVDDYSVFSRISAHTLRHKLRLSMSGAEPSSNPRQTHIDYLTSFIKIPSAAALRSAIATPRVFTSAERIVPETLGKVVALLLLEGDPTGILRSRYPSLLLDSVSGLNGFCKVLNCVAFTTIFKPSEFPRVLQHLESITTLSL